MSPSPFEAPVGVDAPFATASVAAAPAPATAASPFAFSQETVAAPPPVPAAAPVQHVAATVSVPTHSHSPAPAPAPAAAAPSFAMESESYESDSHTIRQLELRAIFGVDRELSAEEILQRARSLPGIRHVARVAAADNATVDAFKRVIGTLGFGAGLVKLYCGSVPIEFIREGGVMLAVQNDGTFAPGVRETLMIVARELGRL